jgi:hypothetical protein
MNSPHFSFPMARRLPTERSDRVCIRLLGLLPDISSRISVNSGTHNLPVTGQEGTAYEHGIFLPNDDWRPLTSPEETEIVSELAGDPTISVFQISTEAYRSFWESDLSALKERDGGSAHSPALADALRMIASRIPGATNVTAGTIILRPSGLPSSTYDEDAKLFIGLHVDDNDEHPPWDRSRARIRCVINLGKDRRHFSFLPLTVEYIYSLCQGTRAESTYELAHCFMSRFPEWSVFRIALDPGEGYVAPTQRIIHDGYTVGMMNPDVTFTCLL